MRVFFAVEPDPASQKALEQLLQSAAPHLRRCGRLTDIANIHLTLLFVGDWPDQQIQTLKTLLDETASRTPPFSIRFDRWGYFDHGRRGRDGRSAPAILWLGGPEFRSGDPAISTDQRTLTELVSQLRKAARSLGIETETRPFTPHLTLTRQLPSAEAAEITRSLPAFEPIEFKVRHLTLMQSVPDSGHMRYDPLHRSFLSG